MDPAAEIEITKAMIEAGVDAYGENSLEFNHVDDIVCDIFFAMVLANPSLLNKVKNHGSE